MDEKKSDLSDEIIRAIGENDKSNRPYDGTMEQWTKIDNDYIIDGKKTYSHIKVHCTDGEVEAKTRGPLFALFDLRPPKPTHWTIYEDDKTLLYATVRGLLNRNIILHYTDKINGSEPIEVKGKSEKFEQMWAYCTQYGERQPNVHLEVGVDFTLIYPNTQNLDVPKEMFYRKNIGRGVKTFLAYEDKDNDIRIIIRNTSSDSRYISTSIEFEYKDEEVSVERLSKRFCDIWRKYISYRKPISEKLEFGVDYVIAMSNEKI